MKKVLMILARIADAMFWRASRRREIARVLREGIASAMTPAQLLEAFSVEPTNPLYRAVQHVLYTMQEGAVDSIAIAAVEDRERAHLSGRIAALTEASERIADLVIEAGKRKRGEQ